MYGTWQALPCAAQVSVSPLMAQWRSTLVPCELLWQKRHMMRRREDLSCATVLYPRAVQTTKRRCAAVAGQRICAQFARVCISLCRKHCWLRARVLKVLHRTSELRHQPHEHACLYHAGKKPESTFFRLPSLLLWRLRLLPLRMLHGFGTAHALVRLFLLPALSALPVQR